MDGANNDSVMEPSQSQAAATEPVVTIDPAVIAEQVGILEEAKVQIHKAADLKNAVAGYDAEVKKLTKKIATDEKQLSTDITDMIKKRRDTVSASYEKEISTATDKLKKAKAKREKAKDVSVKERIKQETEGLISENKGITNTIKKLFSDTKTPSICRSELFFTYFAPSCITEYIAAVVTALFVFIGLPTILIICLMITELLYIILIFAGFILGFGLIYVLLYRLLRAKYRATIDQGVALKKQIRANEKKIAKITAAIKKDKDDKQYGLENYDCEIAQCENELDAVNKKKSEALVTFDEVTSKVITDEVTESQRPSIEKSRQALEQNQALLKDTNDKLSAQNLYVADHYDGLLGKDFMSDEKIDKLIAILKEGHTANVTEAIVTARRQ